MYHEQQKGWDGRNGEGGRSFSRNHCEELPNSQAAPLRIENLKQNLGRVWWLGNYDRSSVLLFHQVAPLSFTGFGTRNSLSFFGEHTSHSLSPVGQRFLFFSFVSSRAWNSAKMLHFFVSLRAIKFWPGEIEAKLLCGDFWEIFLKRRCVCPFPLFTSYHLKFGLLYAFPG